MGQETGNCGCKDYSLLKANTGIISIANGTSALDGTGAVTVLTAASGNGTTIKFHQDKSRRQERAGNQGYGKVFCIKRHRHLAI